MNSLRCPRCGLAHAKKNGHTHYHKQNYRCLSCGRQFVRDSQRVGDDTRALVKRLLLERLSLRGICRVTGLSLTWLLQFIASLYERLPDDLCVAPASPQRRVHLLRLEAEVDELWSFVGRKADKQWLWLAFDSKTRQVLAFFVGDRSRESARQLWRRLPAARPRAGDLLQRRLGGVHRCHPARAASGLRQGVGAHQRGRAVQLHFAPAGLAAGAQDALVFKEAGEPQRGDQVFHLPLQPRGDSPCLTSITF